MGRWSILIGLVVVVAMSGAVWVFSPKGETRTYVWRCFLFFLLVGWPSRLGLLGCLGILGCWGGSGVRKEVGELGGSGVVGIKCWEENKPFRHLVGKRDLAFEGDVQRGSRGQEEHGWWN